MKKNSDFTKIIKKEHEENWIALNEDHSQVIDYDKDLATLRDKLGYKKDKATYMKVLRSDTQYAF